MKRNRISVLTIAAAALCLIGAGREGGGSHGGGGASRGGGGVSHGGGGASRGGGRSSSPESGHMSTIYRRQRVNVPRASMPERAINDQNRAVVPNHMAGGGRITQRAAGTPPSHHLTVTRNDTLVRNIGAQQRNEVVPNHYYWHNDNGVRYSHYYDGRNHWYGFYHGPTFYWTRYYGNRWWWFDGPHSHWDFWWDGYWWWTGPGGAPYVYVDNNYYPYDASGGVTVVQPEEQPVPATIPPPNAAATPANPAVTKDSPDGQRMVQVFGADAQAFLYDKTKTPPVFMKFLGSGVLQARFSGGTGGAPLQILVEYKDDTFALFDADGNSQDSAVQSTEASIPAPPENPDSIPPPPTSAPGQ
ncbi:MAG: hypothetical protein ACHQ49_11050 [Elusimicrobiota bacterium]